MGNCAGILSTCNGDEPIVKARQDIMAAAVEKNRE
jgi:hypothetical protein